MSLVFSDTAPSMEVSLHITDFVSIMCATLQTRLQPVYWWKWNRLPPGQSPNNHTRIVHKIMYCIDKFTYGAFSDSS